MEPTERFLALIDGLFAAGGVARVHRAIEAGHSGMPRDASLMEQPRLIVCLEGSVAFQRKTAGSLDEVQLNPGEGLFVGPGRWVRSRPCQTYASVGVVFYASSTRFYRMQGKPSRDWRPGGPVETCVARTGIGEEARALVRLLMQPPPAIAPEQYFHHAFECLLISARELLATPAEASAMGKARFTWYAACEYITHNLQRPLSRKDVARHVGVHPNHLSRLFAEFNQEPFSAYLQSQRLVRARLLMEDPKLNVSEIARLSGFASGNYFARVFRERSGRTPTVARRPAKSSA